MIERMPGSFPGRPEKDHEDELEGDVEHVFEVLRERLRQLPDQEMPQEFEAHPDIEGLRAAIERTRQDNGLDDETREAA